MKDDDLGYRRNYGENYDPNSRICQTRMRHKLWHAATIDPDRDRSYTDEEKASFAALRRTGQTLEEEQELEREVYGDV